MGKFLLFVCIWVFGQMSFGFESLSTGTSNQSKARIGALEKTLMLAKIFNSEEAKAYLSKLEMESIQEELNNSKENYENDTREGLFVKLDCSSVNQFNHRSQWELQIMDGSINCTVTVFLPSKNEEPNPSYRQFFADFTFNKGEVETFIFEGRVP